MGLINDIRHEHSIPVNADFGGTIEYLGVQIPDFQNVKALLGTYTDSNNLIPLLFGYHVEDARSGVARKGLIGRSLGHLDTIGTTANIHAIFPERRIGVAHQEEHSTQELGLTETLECRP